MGPGQAEGAWPTDTIPPCVTAGTQLALPQRTSHEVENIAVSPFIHLIWLFYCQLLLFIWP